MHTAEFMLRINSLDVADILGYNTQKIGILRVPAHALYTQHIKEPLQFREFCP